MFFLRGDRSERSIVNEGFLRDLVSSRNPERVRGTGEDERRDSSSSRVPFHGRRTNRRVANNTRTKEEEDDSISHPSGWIRALILSRRTERKQIGHFDLVLLRRIESSSNPTIFPIRYRSNLPLSLSLSFVNRG